MNEEFTMTEEEARQALFDLNLEYMSNPPGVRKKLYPDYSEKRAQIRHALAHAKILKMKEEDLKNKEM